MKAQRKLRWAVAAGLLLGSWPGSVSAASDVDILLNKLVERGILTPADAGSIRSEIVHAHAGPAQAPATTAAAPPSQAAAPAPSPTWNWSGDLLLREEYRNRTGSGNDVNRQRIRFRYGFAAKVTDDLKIGARLTTGNTTDPGAPNQSFDTSFNHKNFFLDRAYVEYAPEISGLNEFKLSGGMIESPFWGVGQLVWDEDLSFDGAAVHLAKAVGPVTFFTNDGVFALRTDITEAASLWSSQAGMRVRPFAGSTAEAVRHLAVAGALAYHDYKNVTNPLSESTALSTAGGLKGSSADLKDVNLLNATVELAGRYADLPFGVFGDWVHNTAASSSEDGFQIGVRAGQAAIPFDLRRGWEAGYYFERLQPDAAFGAFTEPGTWEAEGSKNHADTFRADWLTKF